MKTEDQHTPPAPATPPLTEAEKLTARIKELRARKRDMDRADKARVKTVEKTKRLILGRVFLERGAKNPKFHASVMDILGRYLTAEAERKLFDLPPLTTVPKQATAPDNNTDKPASQATAPACPKSTNGVPPKPAPANSENTGRQSLQTTTPACGELSKGASPKPPQPAPENMAAQHSQTATPCPESSEGMVSKPIPATPTRLGGQPSPKPSSSINENAGTPNLKPQHQPVQN